MSLFLIVLFAVWQRYNTRIQLSTTFLNCKNNNIYYRAGKQRENKYVLFKILNW